MIRYETKSKISTLFLALADGERQCEVVRQILCELLDFEPFAAFCRIDRAHKGYLTPLDIKEFLADNNIGYSEKACAAYVRRYSGREGEYVSYPEFLKSVLPMENPRLRTKVSQRPNYKVASDELLPGEVEYALAKVLDREISLYLNTDYQKFTIATTQDYSPLEAFAVIDRFNSGRIDFDNLKSFFRSLALCPLDEEIIAVLRRIDKDDDGVVKYNEFLEALETLDPELKSEQIQKTLSSPMRQGLSTTKRGMSTTSLRSVEKREHHDPIHQKLSVYQKVASPGHTMTYSPVHKYSPDSKQFKISSDNFYGGEKLVKQPSRDPKEFTISTADRSSPIGGMMSGKLDSGLATTVRVKKTLDYGGESRAETRSLLADPLVLTLKQFISLEKDLENAKQNLALRPDFNLYDFFKLFDGDSKGAIGVFQIEEAFKTLGVYSNREEINLFIKRYDSDGDTKLRYVYW